ncbi:cytochrome P450 [Micromonospora sp. NBRC 101691]|uniref:cytochrome P450 n=1 Tax=Micromonospora sp. NBRC 101691 TaxID=3032198 RepID=UPI0024A344F2|nr:cytochrome P450 [Micromonospora sp. NBRC 101691]GLY21552.1 fatty-acid peroxygenase [Micromonospora sp. NBRC 101691]
MSAHRGLRLDDTLPLAFEGYAWLPNRWRRARADAVPMRLLGRPAVALRGPEAARFFYDERHVRRHGALPEPIRSTLFGHGAVHTLDGTAHRVRKAMFLALLTGGGVDDLVTRAAAAWDEAVPDWADRSPVVLFDETARVLTRAVCDWTGVPVAPAEVPALAGDLVALVDGFGTAGPRHWRARRARARREAWLADLVDRVRRDDPAVPAGSAVAAVARHRDADGTELDPRTAAVELLNIIRPTVAVSWFVAFAAHALHRWPGHRDRLRADDPAFTEAFAHEVRRFYPFAPFVGGRAVRDLAWGGEHVPAGAMVLLDIYGQHHDARFWPDPYRFTPERFLNREIDPYELLPQGGGDPAAGHRCPGEAITVALLRALAVKLAHLDHTVPDQDLTIPLRRIPTRPRSGLLVEVRRPTG